MQVVIAADKFKHSLTSFEVCDAIEQGLTKASPDFQITKLPLSDGGDGLADVLSHYGHFETIKATVHDPLWRPVEATYLFSEKERTAFVEMAQASGLHLLKSSEYNPTLTTTFGTGELIKYALKRGAKKLIIGIGGSATNDCGIGMAAALGWRFLDAEESELKPVGDNLHLVRTIDVSQKVSLRDVQIQVACDVTNPLIGSKGATKVYGPQKGATPAMIESLERGMQRFANVVKKEVGMDIESMKSGGAAGGMGAGCVAFLNASILSGADLVLQYSKAAQHIQSAHAVITGEGKIDDQTWNGKLVHAVTKLCSKHNKPVVALCGALDLSAEATRSNGLTAAFSIMNAPMPVEQAMKNAFTLLRETAYNVGCLLGQ